MRGVVLEWLPLALVLAVYDLLRGTPTACSSRPGTGRNSRPTPSSSAAPSRRSGSGTALARDGASALVRLRGLGGLHQLFRRDVPRRRAALVLRRRALPRYVACVALLAGMAFVTFALFPAAPPWLASRMGELDQTTRLIGPISGHMPFLAFSFEGLYERGSEYANPVAAVPSLHAAYTLLITLFLWRSAARWARALLAAYPLAMAFALVYTAEHYVFDILLGWTYTVIAVWVVNQVATGGRRFSPRQARADRIRAGRGSGRRRAPSSRSGASRRGRRRCRRGSTR